MELKKDHFQGMWRIIKAGNGYEYCNWNFKTRYFQIFQKP